MRVSDCIGCESFPCRDVNRACYSVPSVSLKPESISMVLISESAPERAEDHYYARGNPAFAQTTVEAFQDAGHNVNSVKDLVARGIYLTTAVKCAKTAYTIQSATIRECSSLLEKELRLFPNVRVLMLMGDVAIKALNCVAQLLGEKRVIPAGSTYKLRAKEYFFRGIRVFPSYLQVGPSVSIEKGKRKVIAEDLAAAMRLIA